MGDARRTQTLGLRNVAEAIASFAELPDPETPAVWADLLTRLGGGRAHPRRRRGRAHGGAWRPRRERVRHLGRERRQDRRESRAGRGAAAAGLRPRPRGCRLPGVPDAGRAPRHAARRSGGRGAASASPSPAGWRPISRRAHGAVRGDRVRVPVRPDPEAVLDRVPGGRRLARSQLLRPARVGGPDHELPRDRQGRRAGRALVPPRSSPDARGPGLGARLVVWEPCSSTSCPRWSWTRPPAACSTRPTGWSWRAR